MTSKDGPGPRRLDLATLTGVRSGKTSYYRAYVRSDERMQDAVRAMDSISRALVRTVQGPRSLLEQVVRAASAHLSAEWTVLALADGHLQGARPRFLAHDGSDDITTDEAHLPAAAVPELQAIRAGRPRAVMESSGLVRVPMTLEGRTVGMLVARHGLEVDPEAGDLSVLRILANQAAVSLHTSEQYQAGLALHRRAQRLYDAATGQAQDLADRTAELRKVEERLLLAHQRELIDEERHRIARELHDSVTQYVLSAGMAVELARGDAEALGTTGSAIQERLGTAKKLSQDAVEQLRRAIYALHQPHRVTLSTLPELLHEVAHQHKPHLHVQLRIEGDVVRLTNDADHEIARTVGEALFNVATHAKATRAVVRLRYRPDRITVSVADDGTGDPTELSRKLRLERATMVDGRHRGLANMESRVSELGGSLAFRRARLGGVRVEIRIPLPLPPTQHGLLHDLTRPEERPEAQPELEPDEMEA